MTIFNDFNDLQRFRYHVKLCHNEGNGDSWRLIEDSLGRQMQFTYKEVIALRKRDLIGTSESPSSADTQVFRNNISSLHSYLAYFGKTEDSPIGREMLNGFNEKLQSYLDSVNVAPRTKSDRRSHLRAWHSMVANLTQPASDKRSENVATDVGTSMTFHQMLRHAVSAAGYAPKTIAKRAGASASAIQRWLKGAFPNRRAFPSVRRIEVELGLERDALLSRVPSVIRKSQPQSFSIAYRERQRENTKSAYRLRVDDMSPEFLEEWANYFEYKTSRSPAFARSSRGSWRMLPMEKIAADIPPYARRGNRGCVTATMTMDRFRSFVGYLSLPKALGGLGIPLHEAQSFAWLAVPKAIEGFLTFVCDRSGGVVHNGHVGFCSFGASMTHPQTGYLTQQPSFAANIPEGSTRGAWSEACAKAYALYRQWAIDAKEMSRKPYEPIQGLLNLSEPLAPLIRAVNKLDQMAAESAAGSLQEAIYKRDALLLSMLMANPLRARNYILMTWVEDGTGSLYQRENGQWRIRFGANDFKNDRNASQTDYDAPLPAALSDRIDEYLVEFRPRLLKEHPRCASLFPGKNGRIWTKGLSKQVAKVTRRLVPETPGIGPHAVRHLVATDWLRKHPNDFLTAAQLLHDKLETVLRAYAHLRQDDAFNRFEAHLEAVGQAMRR
ncbi:conserved hypothetical protein [Paraburkholderia piptadeniae]|uniref:Tyr recombinase domain-containing protein n=1 Tax=Paraburkholderia piptadeniae TaxID=1701573 RepID=A0A1N7RWL5_9BURK|nr:site-specific integrase [Paraburkholderia piptadeniae]SIT39487.1 conserved hypothetical protein [Paraburkholderia piptadeniae]